MKARNRNRRRGNRSNASNDRRQDDQQRNKGGGGGGGNRNRGRRKNRNRRKNRRQGGGFWGDPEKLPPLERDVRITDDPAAVPRSLGPPPLPGHEKIAEHYFTLVYDRAVATAGALAAAGGLIGTDELTDEDDE